MTPTELKELIERAKNLPLQEPADWRSYLPDLLAQIEAKDAEIARLRKAVSGFLTWAAMKCPCENEEPDPCPLCFASVDNLEPCKAVDVTLPRHLIAAASAALENSRG